MWWPVVKVTFAGKFKNSGISLLKKVRNVSGLNRILSATDVRASAGARGLGGAVGEAEKEACIGGGIIIILRGLGV